MRSTEAQVTPKAAWSQDQLAAMAAITRQIQLRNPWVVLTSAPGLGKSVVANALARRARCPDAIDGASLTVAQLLSALVAMLPGGKKPMDESEQLRMVVRTLSRSNCLQRNARRLIIDNADQMSEEVLLSIRSFVGIQSFGKARVCFVLIGGQRLVSRINALDCSRPSMIVLRPMSLRETRAMCIGMLRYRGRRARMPGSASILVLYLLARGRPGRTRSFVHQAISQSESGRTFKLTDLIRIAGLGSDRIGLAKLAFGLERLAKVWKQQLGGEQVSRQLRWACAAAGVALGMITAHYGAGWIVQDAQATSLVAAQSSPLPTALPGHAPARTQDDQPSQAATQVVPSAAIRSMSGTETGTIEMQPDRSRNVPRPAIVVSRIRAKPIAQSAVRANAPISGGQIAVPGSVVAVAPESVTATTSITAGRAEKKIRAPLDDLTLAGDAIAVGRISEAIAHLRRAIALDPRNFAAHSNLIALLGDRARDGDWLTALNQAAKALPEQFTLAALTAHIELNQLQEANALLEQVPIDRRSQQLHAVAGVLQSKTGQSRLALESYEAARALLAPDSQAHHPLQLARAVSLEQLGRTEEARAIYEETVAKPAPAESIAFARSRLANFDRVQ